MLQNQELRMDIIPGFSMAIAHIAAKESGWGTSRFALRGERHVWPVDLWEKME